MADGRQQIVNMSPEPKGHMGNQPAKMNSKIQTSLFDLFKDLNSGDEGKSTECIVQIVKHFSENSNGVRDQDGNLSAEVAYTIKRLIRGLGTPKPDILQTYFTTLTCLLSSLPEVTCEDVKEIVDKELSVSSSSVSADKKEVLIARTLAWGVLMRSGLLENATVEQQQIIFSDLMTCSKKKSYLPLAAYSFLVDIIPTLESSTFSNVVWPILGSEILKPWEQQTVDSMLLLLVCQNHHKNSIKKYLKKSLGSADILTEDTLKHFAQRLLFSTYLKHPLFRVFSEHLSKPDKTHLLQKFWGEEMPNILATVKHKDLATLELFSSMVESVGPSDQIPLILSDQIVSFLNHVLSDSYKRLFPEVHDCAHKAVVQLGSVLTNPETSDKVRMSVLKLLLFESTCLEFHKISFNLEKSTHVITILIGLLESECAKELAEMFKSALLGVINPSKNKKDVIFAVQQFSRLVCLSSIEDMEWRVEQLKFLIRQSFFKSKQSALTDDMSSTLKQSFFKALGAKLPTLENLLGVLNTLVSYVEELLKSGVPLRVTFSQESMLSWNKMLSLVSKMKDSKPGSVEQIFHLLFMYMGLYLFMDAHMAQDALKELHSCYEHSDSNMKNKKRKSKSVDEPHWVEVTVDLLLSLLSHGSHLLRNVVSIVFTHLRKHITLEALQQILEVLHPDESENALSIVDDANGAEVESGEDEDDDDDSAEDQSDASSIDDDENSDLEDESLDEEETVNDQLRSEIRDALGKCASDNESVDIDEADQDELRRVDEVLVKALQSARNRRQSQQGKKKKQSKVDELLMHFRLRVLDLIDILLAKMPPLSHIIRMIHPLLSLLEVSSRDVHLRSLANRVRSLLNKISSVKKFPSVDGVTHADIGELLTALLNKGNRTAAVFLETVNVVTNCSTMLVRCSEHLPVTDEDDATVIVNICKGALETFLTKRDSLLPVGLFRSILSLHWEGCWELGNVLIEGAFNDELRPIRRMNSFELIRVLLANTRLLKSEKAAEKQYLENFSSALISNAVNLFDNSGPLQQKLAVSLYQVLQLCVNLRKASPKKLAQLSEALTRFSQENPPIGDSKKRSMELQRLLARINGTSSPIKEKEKSHPKKPSKKNGVELNGHSEKNDEIQMSTFNGSVSEDSIKSSKKKKKGQSQENHLSNEAENNRQRKNSQSDEVGGSVKKASKVRHSRDGEDTIPNKKSKIMKTNGVNHDGTKSGQNSNGAEKKKKKKKMHAVK